MNERPVRIGIIGCGSVLEQYLAEAGRLRAQAEVVLACGRPHQRQAAAGFGIPRFTTDSGELIGSPEVDLVVILTPPRSHGSLARAALEAGKHVLVEKPLAASLEEARDLVALSEKSRGLLLCAPFTVLSPTFQAMARRIRIGEIGRPVSARARYGWAGPWWSDWFYRPGGGPLLDLAIYNVSTLAGLLGEARRVTALAGTAVPEREVNGERIRVEVEDNAQVLIEFEGGALAVVTSGFAIQQYRGPAVEIYGTEGTIQMLGDDWDPDGYELWQNRAGCWQFFRETAPDWPWTDGLRHLVECIRTGERPLVTPANAYHVLEVLIRAQASARDGQAKAIESRCLPVELPGAGPAGPAHLIHDRTRASH
jgi:predicted dehydrogenase